MMRAVVSKSSVGNENQKLLVQMTMYDYAGVVLINSLLCYRYRMFKLFLYS